MVAGCGANCMKYTLFVFNLLFFLAGLGLVGMGAVIMVMMDTVASNIEQKDLDADPKYILTIAAVVLMVTGFILMGICFFGCCGAIKEVKCMLGTYAFLIGIIILSEIALIIVMFVYKGKADRLVETYNNALRYSVRQYTGDRDESGTAALDKLQQEAECCGADFYTDFQKKSLDWDKRSKYQVPISCCKLIDKDDKLERDNLVDANCPKNPNFINSYIRTPCLHTSVFEGVLNMVFNIAVAVICGLIAIELIGLIFAICLIRLMGEPRAVPV